MTLSVCLIVKDEADVISRCLDCVKKFADEIIVVDTGSTDGTVEAVRKYTDRIYFFEWTDDFSAARNYSLDKATCDYVMWIDADDVVSEENCAKIKKLVSDEPDFDAAFLKYASCSDGETCSFTYYRERIFRRERGFRFVGAVHEAVTPRGKIIYSDAAIIHKKLREGNKFRNLHIYQKQISLGRRLEPREQFYYGRELLFCGMYTEAAAVLENFLNSDGWKINKTEACLNLHSAYAATGDEARAFKCLLRSFEYGLPNAEICCKIGTALFERGDLDAAEFWYKTALVADGDGKDGGFVNLDYCGFIPNIQLCVIYDRLGKFELANEYNEAAGALKPHNESYLNNKKYFGQKFKEG